MNQVIKYHPDAICILLTDCTTFKLKGLQTIRINEYTKSADEFSRYYKHMSTNSYKFELICFQRWFVLKDFVNKNSINETFIYLDSDVLVYQNLFEVIDLEGYKMTVTKGYGPQYSIFENASSINHFCDFIIYNYTNNEKINSLVNNYKINFLNKNLNGGICDMTLLGLYNFEGNCKDIFWNNSYYFNSTLSNINNDLKDLGYNAGGFNLNFFVFSNSCPKLNNIKIGALHFQGSNKAQIHRYYKGRYKYYYYIIGELNLFLNTFKRKLKSKKKQFKFLK
ncbi:hypothetical protein PK35_05950 [Tamlana nanhaiensis]|uniref:Nucleotide-diphospho-sugar transferase domain-containing protein n=2 Tax=Neotamlana nanhaiensis TaxID=1382798 RepID=A0A0D7W3W6_9FLAO|nr:hypothetical protein PK35_05950 [Tamlana nanhaiensis]